MKRHCKLIISTITMALIFTLVLSPASYALSKQQFGAWVASALSAINIVATSVSAPVADMIEYIADPAEVVYTLNEQAIDEYMNRSTLRIDEDVVVIDGVPYSDVWLSGEAAEKFRVNAFDFKTAFNIASQSEGTFASGAGTCAGVPIFLIDNTYKSQTIKVPASVGSYGIGDISFTVEDWTQNYPYHSVSYYNGNQITSNTVSRSGASNGFSYTVTPQTTNGQLVNNGYGTLKGVGYQTSSGTLPHATVAQPFDFDWVSSVIPADEPLPDDYGLRLRVPTPHSGTTHQWIQDNPEFTQPGGIEINTELSDLMNKIDDLIDLIIPIIPVIDIDYVENEAPAPAPDPEPIPVPIPYPDPDPQPGTVLPDVDFTDLFDVLKNIYNRIADQISISTAIKNLLDKIKWFFDDFFGDLGDILNNLPDVFERHVIDTIRRGLTGLKNIFLPILALLRNALGIWHYVVEWYQAIFYPLNFYLSILAQGYPLITIPIYASIAGVIVIAVYRRFGR